MTTKNKSQFPNYISVEFGDNSLTIHCPVCGKETHCGPNCPHLLFTYFDGEDGFCFYNVHPKLAAEVKRFEAKYVGYLRSGKKDRVNPAAKKLFKKNKRDYPEPCDLASELKLDAERTMVVSVAMWLEREDDYRLEHSVVGIELPPSSEQSKRYKQASPKPSKS